MNAHMAATQRYRGQQAAFWLSGLRTTAWGDGETMQALLATLTGKPARAQPGEIDAETTAALDAFGVSMQKD